MTDNSGACFVREVLSKAKDFWFLKRSKPELSDLRDQYRFIGNIRGRRIKPSREIPPYNYSILHFYLYYCAPPDIPFISVRNSTVFMGSFRGRHYDQLHLSMPEFESFNTALQDLKGFLSEDIFMEIFRNLKNRTILLRDIPGTAGILLHKRAEEKNNGRFQLSKLKELNYNLYNLKKSMENRGREFSNLRWHLNSFKKEGHRVEAVPIHQYREEVEHLIGQWRSERLSSTNQSFFDIRSDKMAVALAHDLDGEDNVQDFHTPISRVLKVDGKVAAFNFGYPLGLFSESNVFAHAVGIADVKIPHLSEYAQMDFWKEVHDKGYLLINDGPTWRTELHRYKNKFRPEERMRFYWARMKILNENNGI